MLKFKLGWVGGGLNFFVKVCFFLEEGLKWYMGVAKERLILSLGLVLGQILINLI